jgi:hypothetical protein
VATPSPNSELRRLSILLIPWSGTRLNAAMLSRNFGVSRHVIAEQLRTLQAMGFVRLLPFLGHGGKPLLNARLCCGGGLESFRGIWTEVVIDAISKLDPCSHFHWWATGRIRQIDLVVTTGGQRIGFRFSPYRVLRNRDWKPLGIGLTHGLIDRGFFLYEGSRAFVVCGRVQGLPLRSFIAEMEEWIWKRQGAREAQAAMMLLNARAGHSHIPRRRGMMTPCTMAGIHSGGSASSASPAPLMTG